MTSSGNGTVSQSTLSTPHMLIAAEIWPPFFEVTDHGNSDIEYSGIMWSLLLSLSSSLNFTFTIKRPPDGKWGVRDAQGQWDGMLGMLKRKEVDFALGPFGMIYEREEACDFTFPVVTSYWAPLVPVRIVQDPVPFVRPYQLEVWVCILCGIGLFVSVASVLDAAFIGRPRSFFHIGFVTRTLFLDAAVKISADWAYQAILTISWISALFVLVHSYSGQLVSFLTVPIAPKLIDSVTELVSQSELPFYIESGSVLDQLGFSSPPDSIYGQMYSKAIHGGLCTDLFQDMVKDNFGQICDGISIRKIVSEDFSSSAKCNFYKGSKDFIGTSFAMAFQEKSPYLAKVNKFILSLQQMGYFEHLMIQLMPNSTSCQGMDNILSSHGRPTKGLTLLQMSGAFFLMLMCLGAAFIAFFVEAFIISNKSRL